MELPLSEMGIRDRFEMEALAAGALRVLTGQEEAKEYTGVPVWKGFDC